MILLPSTNLEKAAVLAERIRQTVERNLGNNSGFATDKNITISIGLTDACAGDTNIETIVKRADEALYKAKEGGRNKVEIEGSAVC
jgi:diguanylate cyclase (GGDEF)-like protein